MASYASPDFDRNTVMCPICLDIFIEPITLMCSHELCRQCYENHFQKADFRCPMCQKRLSSWARKSAAKGSLVNKTKWKFIQENFPQLVQKRLNGEENDELFQPSPVLLAKDGEIHNEYLKLKVEFETEKKAQDDEEESASLQLIQQIIKEEKEEAERIRLQQMQQDEELAKVISEQLNQPVSPKMVNKKLLRSTTSSSKRRKVQPIQCNSIEKYCIKRTPSCEKENSSPDCFSKSFNEQSCSKSAISRFGNLSPKRCNLSFDSDSS